MPNFSPLGSRTALVAAGMLLAGAFSTITLAPARAQSLTVLPVNVQLLPGQLATIITAVNRGDVETSVQIRALAWSQVDGQERLSPTDEIVVSPPIATVPPGGTQVVRLVLRHPAQATEATYRVLVDQIPPVATPGTVRIALRLSIPVFAQGAARTAPRIRYSVEARGSQAYLVMANEGDRHEKLNQVSLQVGGGRPLSISAGSSPYILAGATDRWPLVASPGLLIPGTTIRLTAQSDSGAIDQPVSVVALR